MIELRKYALYIGVIALVVAGFSVFSGIALADDPAPHGQEQEVPEHVENIGPDVVFETPGDGPNPDDVILAAETGLPIDQIASAMAYQKEFGEYAIGLLAEYPGQISGIWLDNQPGIEGPNTRGNVRFKDATPTDIETIQNVVLTGGGLISLSDNKLRAEVAAEALNGLGYNNFATYYLDFVHQSNRSKQIYRRSGCVGKGIHKTIE